MPPKPLPPWLRDGQYRNWEIEFANRFPLALSEMRWPSKPLETFDTEPLARWGIDIMAGWRPLLERLLERLECEIAAHPIADRDRFRIVQIKEKFGRLTVYLDAEATPAMRAAIDEAGEVSIRTCEVCGVPGQLEERNCLVGTAVQATRDLAALAGARVGSDLETQTWSRTARRHKVDFLSPPPFETQEPVHVDGKARRKPLARGAESKIGRTLAV